MCPLLDVLSPSIRANIGSSVLTETELNDIDHTAEVMAHFGIQLNRRRTPSGNDDTQHLCDEEVNRSMYDPPIDSLALYQERNREGLMGEAKKCYNQRGVLNSSTSSIEVMQFLNAELQKKIVRRRIMISGAAPHKGVSNEVANTPSDEVKSVEDISLPLATLSASSRHDSKRAFDSLGSIQMAKKTPDTDRHHYNGNKRIKVDARFKYNQGFSSAVRRAVHISEFCQ